MRALIIVDVQYDFMPGGALGVSQGDVIATPINRVRDRFDFVVFTQDWHPADHCSFKVNGGMWPVHCVQGSKGAEIDARILRDGDMIVKKGVNQDIDSYSGFWDNERKHKTGLDDLLKSKNIDTVYICGLATDYCVKFTALDAVDAGYRVFLIKDACRGVEVTPGDSERAVAEMLNAGVNVIESGKI
ncbi:MAG: bifunctional nicotinamidase/pyrazinamidase [Fibrobacter sp.]|nr:bifunctional nicotinamidase/pyrazinamidase [Fibrobacter sp.]